MDVRLPDGTLITNVPEGTTQQELLSRLKAAGITVGAPAPAPAPRAPAEDPGFAQSALIGAGRTFDRIGKGVQQLYYGARSAMADPGANPWDAKLADLKQAAASDDEAYNRLKELRPWATGLGEAAPTMVLPGFGGGTLIGTAARQAGAAALPELLSYGDAEQRLGRGAVAGATGALFPVAAATIKAGKALIDPLSQGGREAIAGRLMNRVVGDNAPEVAQRMAKAAPLVPGSLPTAAQVAKSGGIAALERAAAAANPEPYTQRAMDQAAARIAALRTVAQDDAALAAAVAARDKVASGLYAQSDAAVVPVDDVLRSLLDRMPSGTLPGAQELQRIAGKPFGIADDMAPKAVPTGLLDAMGAPITKNVPGKPATITGDSLDAIKKSLSDKISAASLSGTGPEAKRAMTGLLDDYLSWVDNQIPAYQQARQEFARLSKPVNQMEIGQELLNKVSPAINNFREQSTSETVNTFAKAMRDADETAARVTGFKGAKMADIMSPSQMGLLDAVARDLGRKVDAEQLGRGVGSDTVQKLAMQNIAHESGMPRVTGWALDLPGARNIVRALYGENDKQVVDLLAEAMLDPKKAAALMQGQQPKFLANNPQARQLLQQIALRPSMALLPLAQSGNQSAP